MKEKESIRKELDRTKTKLRETENKLKNSIQEKIKLQVSYQLAVVIIYLLPLKTQPFLMPFYQSEKAEAHKEIKKLQSQRTLLERDLRKRDSVTVDKRHEQNSMPQELAGVFDQAVQMQVFIILCEHNNFLGSTVAAVTGLALLPVTASIFIDHCSCLRLINIRSLGFKNDHFSL